MTRSRLVMAFAAQPLLLGLAVTGLNSATAHAASAAPGTPAGLPGLLIGLRSVNAITNTYVENADGTGLHPLYPTGQTDSGAVTWSPDGDWIVSTGGSGESGLSHPDGSGGIPSDAGTGSAFTPDGSKIVYGQTTQLAIQLAYTSPTCSSFNPTTGQPNNCSKPYFSTDTGGDDRNVTISPSGVVDFQHDTMLNLYTVAYSDIWTDHGTKTPGLLIADGTEPSLSPDGTLIAFVRQVGNDSQIFVQAADGSGTATQETSGAGAHTNPSWRTDGTGLFYTYNATPQNFDANTGHQLTFTGGTTTDTVVPGGLFDVSQEPLASHTTYHAYGPTRLLDTRKAIGVPTTTPVGPGGTVTLAIDGAQGLPTSGITAVVLNVTATAPTSGGYLTAYADGQPQPATSNVNFGSGQTVSNLVTVPVIDGKIRIGNGSGGTVHVVADAFGYYTSSTSSTSSTTGNAFTAVAPTRVLDTRSGIGVRAGVIGTNGVITLKVAGVGAVPANATAAIVNLTATGSNTGGYLTAYPASAARPTTSNLNFAAGETRPNLVVVPLGANGSIDIFNRFGQVNAVADLLGYFTPGTATGATLDNGVPTRILDTRKAIGVATTTPVAPGATLTLSLPGLPPSTAAVILNVTVTAPTSGGHLTVYPGSGTLPTTSNLNFSAGETIPNLVVAAVANGEVSFHNGSAGTVHIVADLFGAYAAS